MDIKLNEILIEILKFPEVPKPYRDLKNYYAKNKKTKECECINKFLLERFGEIPDLNDNYTNNHKK